MTPDKDLIALLPCPFCGGDAIRNKDKEMPVSSIICATQNCGCNYGPFNDLEDGWDLIVKGWNTRQTQERKAVDVNYKAWSKSLLSFIEHKNLKQECTDYCGGFPPPFDSFPDTIVIKREVLEGMRAEAAKGGMATEECYVYDKLLSGDFE